MDKVIYGTLGDPITPDYVRDMNDLEQKMREILKEAKRVEKMGEKLNDDIAKAQDMLKHARNMEEKYVTLIQKQIEEGGDPQLARNLEFTVPTTETLARMYIKNLPYVDKNRDEVRATPIENIVDAKELLENNQSQAALEIAVKLMTKALVQQEKDTSSRWHESDAALCQSSTTSKARGNGYHGTRPDNESHTGSSEARRREAPNKADAIPISSDDRPHGKGLQRNPSPARKNYPAYGYHQDKATPRRKTNMPPPKYKTFEIPQGGMDICDNDGKRGRSRDASHRDEPPRREASRDGGSKQREQSRHDDGAHRSGDKDKHRSSRHRDDKGQGSRCHDNDLAPQRAEGSHRSCKDLSQDVESKRHDPSPSPPSSPHGGGGGGPARSRSSRKDPQDHKPYDTRTHLNEIAKSQTAFFPGPKCFGQRIRDEPIPHGFKIEKNIRQYNGVDRPLTWLQDYFNIV
jgi:cell division septum initiation protein DivIVA